MGLAPRMEPGISLIGVPLSAQETNSGLNIDSPAQSQAGWGSLPFRARAVYQPPVENSDCWDFGLICSQLPGGERRQRQQPGEGISGQGWSVSPPGLDTQVWQDLGSNEMSLCAQGSAAELRVTVSSSPFPCKSAC